jgi:hypothetical protein
LKNSKISPDFRASGLLGYLNNSHTYQFLVLKLAIVLSYNFNNQISVTISTAQSAQALKVCSFNYTWGNNLQCLGCNSVQPNYSSSSSSNPYDYNQLTWQNIDINVINSIDGPPYANKIE